MRCDEFLDRHDRLDSGEEPGLFLRLHLASCPACRARVAEQAAALNDKVRNNAVKSKAVIKPSPCKCDEVLNRCRSIIIVE